MMKHLYVGFLCLFSASFSALAQESSDYNFRMNGLERRIEALEERIRLLEGGAETPETGDDVVYERPHFGIIRKQNSLEALAERSLETTGMDSAVAFDLAYGSVVRGEYDLAQTALADFLAAYPDDPLVPKARYWLGESHFAQGDFQEAASLYVALYRDDKTGELAPDALFMLGRSLEALEKLEAACTTYTKVQDDFSETRSLAFIDALNKALDACANN